MSLSLNYAINKSRGTEAPLSRMKIKSSIKPFLYVLAFIVLMPQLLRAQRSNDEALALQYFQNAEYEKAAAIYEKLFSKPANAFTYYDQYLNTLIKIKKYDEAEKVVKKMIKIAPENYAYQVDFGRILQEQGQQTKANEWYNNIIKNLPDNEVAIREISIAFYRSSAYDFAIKTLLQGRKVLKDESLFGYDLISLYRFQKNKPMLIQEYLSFLGPSDTENSILAQAKNAFSTLLDTPEDFDLLKISLLRKIQKEPQTTAFTDLLAWVYIQQKEYSLALKQIISLDKRLKEDGERIYEFASTLIASKAYDAAIEALNYLVARGSTSQFYVTAKIQLLNCKNQLLTSGKFAQSDLLQLEQDYLSLINEFGKTTNTVFAMRQLASLQAFHLHKVKEAEQLLENALKVPNLPPSVIAPIKLDLGDIYILTNEPWEAALMYGQVEKQFANEPNGQEAKLRGAKLSFYQGEFTWAYAQLKVLKSSTSQLTANDALNLSLLIQENTETLADSNALKKYAYADLLVFKNETPKALLVLDSIHTLFPGNSLEDDILMTKARIYLKQDNVTEAVNQLRLITQNYKFDIWGDDAWFMLGDIYENKLQDKEKAKECYEKIINEYPGSILATEARKRFRNLRGDAIG